MCNGDAVLLPVHSGAVACGSAIMLDGRCLDELTWKADFRGHMGDGIYTVQLIKIQIAGADVRGVVQP